MIPGWVEKGTDDSGAAFSEDEVYRYALWREWTPMWKAGKVLTLAFVMLNPSTADHEVDDPTIRRCVGYAKNWGYDRLHVVNLFALRSTDPRALRHHPDPVGPENEHALKWYASSQADLAIAAWGRPWFDSSKRFAEIRELLAPGAVRVLGLTKTGEPRHPLYMPKDCGHHAPEDLAA